MAKIKRNRTITKRKKVQQDLKETEKKPPIKRKTFNVIYTAAILIFFSAGILLLILSNSVFKSDIVVYISLALIGIGIILLVQRSVYRQTAPVPKTEEKDEDEESLRLRPR